MSHCPFCSTRHSPHCRGLRDVRWPAEPLLELLRADDSPYDIFHCSTESLERVRVEGLKDWEADRWATRLGYHPSSVWALWDRAALTVVDEAFVFGNGWRRAWEMAS